MNDKLNNEIHIFSKILFLVYKGGGRNLWNIGQNGHLVLEAYTSKT